MTRIEQIEQTAMQIFHGTGTYIDIARQRAFIEGAEWADKYSISPWHNIDEELPPFGVDVYVYSTYYSRFGEWKTRRYKEALDENGCGITIDGHGFNEGNAPYYAPDIRITHWRLVPKFPKEQVL